MTLQIVRKKLTPDEISPPNLRWNEDCDCVQQTPDGGTTWVDVPGADPRSAPGFQLPPLSTADPRCDAAANMVALVRQTIERVAGAGNVFSLSSILLTLWLLAMTGIGILVDLIIIFCEAVASIGFVAVSEAFTEDVYNQLLCTFYCNIAADGSVSAAQLDAIRADINANYDIIVSTVMGVMLNSWGEVGLSNAGAAGSETGDCTDCNCAWVAVESFCDSATGDWDVYSGTPSPDGVIMNTDGHGWPAAVWLRQTLVISGDTVITEIAFYVNDRTSINDRALIVVDGSIIYDHSAISTGIVSVAVTMPAGSYFVELELVNADPGAISAITGVRWTGTGTDPFGTGDDPPPCQPA